MTRYLRWERARVRRRRMEQAAGWLFLAFSAAALAWLCSGCSPVPECPSDTPLKCYTEDETRRVQCCPEDKPYSCLGTTYCAIDAQLCPGAAFYCDILDADPRP